MQKIALLQRCKQAWFDFHMIFGVRQRVWSVKISKN